MRTGLIGCGRIGYKFDLDPKRSGIWTHAKAYDLSSDFVGVYDIDGENAKECARTYNTAAFKSINELLESQIDVLSVATDPSSHYTIIKHVINHPQKPKIIWVEKPFTGNYERAKELTNSGAAFHVNYQRRYCAAYKWIKGRTKPQHVDIIYSGGLLNTASHYIDIILWLYDMPASISKITATDFIMQYRDFNVSFSMLKAAYYYCNTTFFFGDSKLVVPPIATSIMLQRSTKSPNYSEYLELSTAEEVWFDYKPMTTQLSEIDKYVSNDKAELNDGLQTLLILKELQ